MKKRGISLIVLVITIIVIVILGTAVIVTFVKNNPIETAKIAVLKGDAKTFNEELTLTFADEKLKDKEFDPEIINAASVEDMKKYIPSFSEKYYGKLCIVNGKLAYVKGNVTEKEKTSLEEVGLVPRSYITEEGATNINKKAEDAQIPSDAITTDITEYIDGIPEDYAEKFTIYQGRLYYRYEKTTYDERVSLHAAKIPFLPGDANEDGTISEDDRIALINFIGYFNYDYKNNIYFVCDMNYDGYIDVDYIEVGKVINGSTNLEEYIDLEGQKPNRVALVGAWYKSNVIYLANNTPDYKEIMKQIPAMTKQEAMRFTIIDNELVFRYDLLSDEEISWVYEYQFPFSIGDVNFDGIIDEEDAKLIKSSTQGLTLTDKQKVVADVNNDKSVDIEDYVKIKEFISGNILYSDLYNAYFQ